MIKHIIAVVVFATMMLLVTCCWAMNDKLDYSSDKYWYQTGRAHDENKIDVFYIVHTSVIQARDAHGNPVFNSDLSAKDRALMDVNYKYMSDTIFESNDFNFISPYYRQMTFESFFQEPSVVMEAEQKARNDICDAFDYYMEHENNGRPFIIAGFSQGGLMTKKLLMHMTEEQYSKMIAAYSMGFQVTAEDLKNTHIKPATGEDDLGVIISYNSVASTKTMWNAVEGNAAICINPLNWKTDDTPAMLNYDGDEAIVYIDPEHKVLVVVGLDPEKYCRPPMSVPPMPLGVYHMMDIKFYVDEINQNAIHRADLFPITNNDILTLSTVRYKIIGNGTLNLEGADTITTNKSITQGTVNVNTNLDMQSTLTAEQTNLAATKTLKINADNLKGDVTNNGTVKLGAGTLATGNTITGGAIETCGDVTANANDLASSEGITNNATNTLSLNGGTIQDNISGTGTTRIIASVKNEKNKTITQGGIIIDTTGNFTTDATPVKSDMVNTGVVTFTGGKFDKKYTSLGGITNIAGSVKFNDTVTLTSSVLNFNIDGKENAYTFITATEPIDLTSAIIGLVQRNKPKLAEHEEITLIDNVVAGSYKGSEQIKTRVAGGLKNCIYGVEIKERSSIENANANTDHALMIDYLGQEVSHQTKSITQARLGTLAAVNSASDLIASSVMENAKPQGKEWKTFAVLGGSHNRYDEIGSNIDLNMFNVAAGLSRGVLDNLTLGVFLEGGDGRYNTENKFVDGNVAAKGDVNYFGGGIFVKAEGKKTNLGQLHGEVSFRAGHINSKYNSPNFSSTNTYTSFDMSGAYLGAHAGFGYKWAIGNESDIDSYVKYLWNSQNGTSPVIGDEQFNLDAINSHRLRAGFRYNSKADVNGFNFFGGLAYEYEFSGKATGQAGEYTLIDSDFRGGSGMAEVGLKFQKGNSPWKGELAVQGYTGKRESIGVNLGIWYEFGH